MVRKNAAKKKASAAKAPTRVRSKRAADAPPPPANARAKSPPANTDRLPVRSEGQRLLLEVEGSLSVIARAVGCSSKATVGDWRRGLKVPGKVSRERLEAAYGIPARSWDKTPDGAAAPPKPRPPKPAKRGDGATTTLEDVELLIESIKDELESGDVLPAERVRLNDSLVRALGLKLRLDRESELLEDRIVREHPKWARMRAALIEALIPFPEAARAVAAALQKLEV